MPKNSKNTPSRPLLSISRFEEKLPLISIQLISSSFLSPANFLSLGIAPRWVGLTGEAGMSKKLRGSGFQSTTSSSGSPRDMASTGSCGHQSTLLVLSDPSTTARSWLLEWAWWPGYRCWQMIEHFCNFSTGAWRRMKMTNIRWGFFRKDRYQWDFFVHSWWTTGG